jgi:hypothetical protein
MRKIAALVVAALLLVACAERRQLSGEPPPEVTGFPPETEAPPDSPGGGADTTCETVNGGNPSNFPRFVEVELESEDGVDRITFGFEPDPGAPNRAPWHFISFVDELVTEGEGRPVQVEGEAFLVVSFQAIGVDLSGEDPVEVYTGPKEFSPGYDTLKEVVHLGDFEGQVSWGLGLARQTCFVLDAGKDHITLEFLPA